MGSSMRFTLDLLTYLAKTNGFEDIALEIVEADGLTESDVDDIPDFDQSTMKTPSIVTSTANLRLVRPSFAGGESSLTALSLMGTWKLGLSLMSTVMLVPYL